MTVGTESPEVTQVAAGAGDYSFSFLILEDANLEVTHTDAEGIVTTYVLTTDYTVTNSSPGGTVHLTEATISATTGTIEIKRVMTIDQVIDWVNNSAFDMAILEAAIDKLTMIAQDLDVKATEASTLLNYSGIWATSTVYGLNKLVHEPDNQGNVYVCLEAHTSGTFATDLAAGKWAIYFNIAYATAQAVAAAASAAAALVSENAAAADLVLTNADVVLTNADVVSTNADVVTTNADVVLTNADVVLTGLDAIATAADLVLTDADTVATAADAAAAAASAAAAAASAAAGLYNDVQSIDFSDSPYTVLAANAGDLFRVDTSGGAVAINATDLTVLGIDFRFAVVKVTGDANDVTVTRSGTDTINGGTSQVLDTQWIITDFIGDTQTTNYITRAAAADIADGQVSNAKLTDMAQDTIKGRTSGAGTGDPVDLTKSQALTILNVEDGADVTDETNVVSSLVSTGSVAPSSTPSSVGLIYVDTVTAEIYISTGTSSSADWALTNAPGGTNIFTIELLS